MLATDRSFLRHTLVAALFIAATTNGASAQSTPSAAGAMSASDLTAFARIYVSISAVHDSLDALIAARINTTPNAQQSLRDTLRARVDAILHHAGMSEAEYQKKTFVVGTNMDNRKTFDSVVAKLTGVPTPGQLVVAAAIPVPAGPAGTHIGHVVNAFNGTPDAMGLLPTAFAEARIAITHAALGARQPGNLDYMKLHAGHVINAIDPAIVAAGPGRGYGVKRAAQGIADHIELAAKATGASPNVILHANHIATSARNTVARCDQAIALARQVQAAGNADDAAAAMAQLVKVTAQLVAGFDANGDGKVTWEAGEGGLQQVQDHVTLMLAAEPKAGK